MVYASKTDYLPKSNCKHRGLYRIYARNLRIGVYNEATGEFSGIREKFGNRYVFGEYHWDNGPPFGTVKPVELLPEELPADISPTERMPDLLCNGNYPAEGCGRLLKKEEAEGQEFMHEHADGVPCAAGALVRGYYPANDALFAWLKEMELKYPFDLHWDRSE